MSIERGLQDTTSNVTFGMAHLWAQWLRFSKNQWEGPSEDNVLAIKYPYFGHFYEWGLQNTYTNVKFDMEYTCTHWLGFRENKFEGPCFGHKRAIFWPFLGMGATEYIHQCKIWRGIYLYTLIRIQGEQIWRTLFWP